MSKKNICFVIDEFVPFKMGGIGRVIQSLYLNHISDNVSWHFICVDFDEKNFNNLKNSLREGDNAIIFNSERRLEFYDIDFIPIADVMPYLSYVKPITKSIQLCANIISYTKYKKIEFDYIEFPDFRGWGYASAAVKRAGLAFNKTTISIRIHSTLDMIDFKEAGFLQSGEEIEIVRACEYLSMRYADNIVGHLDVITKENVMRYGLDKFNSINIQTIFPPILPFDGLKNFDFETDQSRNIVFSARMQPFKRLELFLEGVGIFLDEVKDYHGQIIIACSGWNRDYIDFIKNLVPAHTADKIIFDENLSGFERSLLISRSIFVMTSTYESLCLAAYEASLSGALTLLPKDCVAFSDKSTPWVDGENCILFEPTPNSLNKALQKALVHSNLEPVKILSGEPSWNSETKITSAPMNLNLGVAIYCNEIIENAYDIIYNLSNYIEISEICLVVSGYSGPVQNLIVNSIKDMCAIKNIELSVIVIEIISGRSVAFNEAWRQLQTDTVLFLDAGDIVDTRYIKVALTAISNNPDIDGVISQMALYSENNEVSELRDVVIPLGDAIFMVGMDFMSAHHLLLLRKSSLNNAFDPGIHVAEELDLLLRLSLQKKNILPLPFIGSKRNSWSTSDGNKIKYGTKVCLDIVNNHNRMLGSFPSRDLPTWIFERMSRTSFSNLCINNALECYLIDNKGCDFKIYLLEKRNKHAKSSEVWIENIAINDISIDLSCFYSQHGWVLEQDGRIRSSVIGSDLCTTFRMKKNYKNKIYIKLLKHQWSGIVVVRLNDTEKEIDLYTDGREHHEIVYYYDTISNN